jgi:hypothetical protein
VPFEPTDKPISDSEITTDERIKVTFADPAPDNGGAPIISYELVMDDGMSGSFTTIVGLDANSLLTEFTIQNSDIVKGRRHRFKYRAKNVVGWGPYSDDSYVLAATVPDRAERPYFLAFAADQLSIVIPRSLDNGGTPIASYELWVDDGDDYTSDFHQVSGYTSNAIIYQATVDDGLTSGKTYRFISRSVNEIGASDYSVYGYIAFGNVPEAPGSPLRVSSTETMIEVEWTAPSSSDLSIKGYILNMDDGTNTDLLPIYIGTNRPDILSYQVGNLETGLPYRFTVQAVNINGNSQQSLMTTYYSCRAPQYFSTPYYIASDLDTMTIEIGWSMPTYEGGCAVLGYKIFMNDGNDGELTT